MPTYEYECTRCDHRFEKFQSMRDEPLKRCPECRGKIRRVLGTGAGIIFKGSGFYQTDYRSDSYKRAAKSDTAPSPASDGGGKTTAGKADKPATTEKKAAKKAG